MNDAGLADFAKEWQGGHVAVMDAVGCDWDQAALILARLAQPRHDTRLLIRKAEWDRLEAIEEAAEVILHHIGAGTLPRHPERVEQLASALLADADSPKRENPDV